MLKKIRNSGFTLIEILVVIGIIAILATIVIIAINPARQFAQARNTQRWSNVNTYLNAIGQRMADNRGVWKTNATCTTTLPGTETDIGTGAGLVDLEPCLVPTYISTMLFDPSNGDAADTGYSIVVGATGRITISAPLAELASESGAISVTR